MMAVTSYLQRAAIAQSAEQARLALQTELDRLDALRARWWTELVAGLVVVRVHSAEPRRRSAPPQPS
jgi:hypothetical protein